MRLAIVSGPNIWGQVKGPLEWAYEVVVAHDAHGEVPVQIVVVWVAALAKRRYAERRSGGLELKFKFGMVSGVMAAALSAGPVAAADIQGTASFSGAQWVIKWPNATTLCMAEMISQITPPFILTIDGAAINAQPSSLASSAPTTLTYQAGPPDGVLSSATINGADHLTCGADRLMLPGAVVVPPPVPTLSEWAMILLGALLAGGAALTIHRRRTA